jgi:hypothetical protein
MSVESPSFKHNHDLAAAYIAKSGVLSRYPKVSEQLECLPLDTSKLYPFGYNPSIADHGGEIVMVYRYHSDKTLSTKLAIHSPPAGSNRSLGIPGKSLEDPRLWLSGNKLCLSWVESDWPSVPPHAVVKCGEFSSGEVVNVVQPPFGHNDWSGIEKNWVPFEHAGAPVFIYQCHPSHRVSGHETVWETAGPRWPYGDIRGGTPPVEYEGKLLRFFHSRLDNEWIPPRHRYFVGAYLMEPEPPFAVVRVSRRPILYGSEVDSLTPDQRKACIHWKTKVVFPGGVVVRDGHWLLSVGVNDSACAIVKVKPENLNL